MKVTIPRFTVGTDIETKDTVASAYILSIASVMFDNYTLKPVSILNVTFNPNDPEQGNRTSSDRTLDWWAGNDASSPCKLAHELTWNGTLGFRAGMEEVDKYFRSLPYGKFTMPMKGPDFDYVIIKHALRELGMYRTPLHARPLDSSRTIERVNEGLELPPISDLEVRRFWKSDTRLPHTAVYDAAVEGYEAARTYHAIHLIKTIGYEETCAYLRRLADTDVDLEAVAAPKTNQIGYGEFIYLTNATVDTGSGVKSLPVWLNAAGKAAVEANPLHTFQGECLVRAERQEDLYGLHHYNNRAAALIKGNFQ